MVSLFHTAKFTFQYYCELTSVGSPKSTDPPLRIHDGVSTCSSGHTTVESIMEPQWLPI